MAETFQKRSGCTDKGKDYETLNIANIGINLLVDEKIQDFHISSNDAAFGDFDDIVIQLEKGADMYAFQLKHSNRGNLSLEHLIAHENKDFSIKKYFKSVQTLNVPKETKFILYTNLKFNAPQNTFSLPGEDFPVTVSRTNPINAFEISSKQYQCHCYKFSIVYDGSFDHNSSKVSAYESFFESFFLYTNQEDKDQLERRVIEKFKTHFCGNETECDQYIKFLNKWNLAEGTKEKLNKKWMKSAIALKVFSSRIQPLSFGHHNGINHAEIVRRNILRDAISVFDITIFDKQSYEEVKKIWEGVKCEVKILKIMNKLRMKYQLSCPYICDIDQVDSLTLSILLWLMGACPLLLMADETVYKTIGLYNEKNFILFTDDDVNLCKNVSGFRTLSDLKIKTSQYNELIQNFTCSLQGKEEISLQNLIKDRENISRVLKTDDLLSLVKDQRIGESNPNISEPYIERYLLKNVIDFKILDNITKDSVVILDCVLQKADLQNRLKWYQLINVNDYLKAKKNQKSTQNIESSDQESHKKFSSLDTIYLSEEPCTFSEFNAVRNKARNAKKNCHQFRVRDDGNLEWIRSKGDVSDVEKYKLSEYYTVNERDLDSSIFKNNINLLISDPGMGKSEVMKTFKINCFRDCFTVIVDSKDVYSFLKNTTARTNYVDAFQIFLLDEKYKQLSDRDKAIFRIFLKKNKIVYVWDSLDELSDGHRYIVSNMIVELSKNCVQWVTSRCHLQNMLQNKFNVLCLNLNKFDEDEQRNYILQRLADDNDDGSVAVDLIIKKVKSSFVLVEHKDILGIPLQIFMLTELLRKDREKYSALLNKFFLLTDLYGYFIDEKIDIFIKQALPIVEHTTYSKKLIQGQKDKILEEYSNAALMLLFPKTILTELGIQNKINFPVIDESHQHIGLVTDMKDQIPRFLHNSFAEYLAASYFTNNLQHNNILKEILFDQKYNNVRFFFDLLLSRDSAAHVAILYRDFSFIKNCNDDQILATDVGGRTLLHLACSWGQRYSELTVKYGGTYTIDDHGKLSTVPDKKGYLETLDYLLAKCDISQYDGIYHMTADEYARKNKCLAAEMRIMMKQSINEESIGNDLVINMLYYSAYYGYSDAFVFFFELFEKKVPKIEIDERSVIINKIANNVGLTLLHIASIMGHVKIVEFVLEAGADIDVLNQNRITPLHAAAAEGHEEIVELLVKSGADMNLANLYDVTPLNTACKNGHLTIVEILVTSGADINFANTGRFTPLNTAAAEGHYTIVEYLVKADAYINLASVYGVTPLNTACKSGHGKIVEFLVGHHADINLANEQGLTPLINAACKNGNINIVRFLVEAGADMNLANKKGFTALNAASRHGHYDIVEFLIEKGADINLANKDGFTPLNAASRAGHYGVAALLVKAGANVNRPNKNGFTPLNAAAGQGHYEIVELLVGAGADFCRASDKGFTPLDGARRNGHNNVCDFLDVLMSSRYHK